MKPVSSQRQKGQFTVINLLLYSTTALSVVPKSVLAISRQTQAVRLYAKIRFSHPPPTRNGGVGAFMTNIAVRQGLTLL